MGIEARAERLQEHAPDDMQPLLTQLTIGDKDDYYAASLTLLAAVAQREVTR